MQKKPPAAYWGGVAVVLALVTLAWHGVYSRLLSAWGPWNFSDGYTPYRIAIMVVAAAVYAVFVWLAITRWQRIMRPFVAAQKFLNDVWVELQRVVWPSHEDTYAFTVVVIVAVVVVAVWVAVIDAICVGLMSPLYR